MEDNGKEELRRSAENNSEDFILIIIGNGHDLSPSLDVPEKHRFRFAFRNELFGNYLKPELKGNFILNLRKGYIEAMKFMRTKIQMSKWMDGKIKTEEYLGEGKEKKREREKEQLEGRRNRSGWRRFGSEGARKKREAIWGSGGGGMKKKVWKRLGRREWINGGSRESVNTFCTTPTSTADSEPVPPFPSLLGFSSLLFSNNTILNPYPFSVL